MSRIFSSRFATMMVALVLAVGAAAAVVLYVSRYRSAVDKRADTVTAYVAAKAIPAGTSGDKVLSDSTYSAIKISKSGMPDSAIVDLNRLKGTVAATAIAQGQFLVASQFPEAPNNLTALTVKGNYRAVQVPVDTSRGLVGTLKANDWVDVVATFMVTPVAIDRATKQPMPTAYGQPEPMTVTLLRGIEVLSISQNDTNTSSTASNTGSGNTGTSSGVPLYATLSITDADAQKLVFALENGKIWLTLRGERPTDSWRDSSSRSTVTTLESMIAGLKGFQVISPQSVQKAGQTSQSTPSGS
jgi:pilus assembly protein CpaB